MNEEYEEQDEIEEKPVTFKGIIMPTEGGGYTYDKGYFFTATMPMQDNNILFKKRISAKEGLNKLMKTMKSEAPFNGGFVGKPSIDNCLKPETGIPMAGGYINPIFTSEIPMDSSFRMKSAVQNYRDYTVIDDLSRETLTKFEAEINDCGCPQCVAEYQSKILKIATEQCAHTAVYVLNPLIEDIKETIREVEFEKICKLTRENVKALLRGIKTWEDLPEKYDRLEQILIETADGKITEKEIKEGGYKNKDEFKNYVFEIMMTVYQKMAESPFRDVYTYLETKRADEMLGLKVPVKDAIKLEEVKEKPEKAKEEPVEEGSWQHVYKENGVALPYSEA